MSPRRGRRLSETLTGLASLSFPRARRADGRVVRDCAREAVDSEGLRRLPRESLSLVAAGARTRAGVAARDLRRAPWREALAVLTLPLAATLLLVWTFGFISRYDHWPLGEGWALLLGGSLVAVVGAALARGRLVAAGALAVLVAAASPYLGFGVEGESSLTPSFFRGWNVDIGAASLLPTLLLVVAGLSLSRAQRPLRGARARLAAGFAPALIAAVYLFPGPPHERTVLFTRFASEERPRLSLGSPYPMPWIPESRPLLRILGLGLVVMVVLAWRTARTRPAWALASGLVLASLAYPLAWASFRGVPVPYWGYSAPYYWAAAAVPFLLGLTLVRRAGRASAAAR
jgi:hypothetical protein